LHAARRGTSALPASQQTRPRATCARGLALDSGYLTRMLRSLEREGLIAAARDPADRRRRGYLEIERYNDDPYANHWFEKRLGRTGL
jgi:hypothetical protein